MVKKEKSDKSWSSFDIIAVPGSRRKNGSPLSQTEFRNYHVMS